MQTERQTDRQTAYREMAQGQANVHFVKMLISQVLKMPETNATPNYVQHTKNTKKQNTHEY